MSHTLRSAALLTGLLCVALTSQSIAGAPGHLWSHRYGGTLTDNVVGVAFDASRNVFIAGTFANTVNFGGSDLVSTGGSFDTFLAKYDSNGNHLWSRSLGTTGSDLCQALALDPTGNPVVGGTYTATTNMGGANLPNGGGTDIYIAKYSSAGGGHVWSVGYGIAGNENLSSITVDGSSNVIVGGQVSGTVNVGGANIVASGQDGYIVKYSSLGVFQWQKQYGGFSSDGIFGVAADATGNIYATGQFFGTVDFGGGPIVGYGGSDIVVLKLDPTNAHLWSKHYGGANTEWGNCIALNGAGTSFVISGLAGGSLELGGGTLSSFGGQDGFVARYDSNGNYLWGHNYGGAALDNVLSVSIGGNGDVAFAGVVTNTAHFGGIDLVATGTDSYVARTDAAGNLTGVRGFANSNNSDSPRGVAADINGNFAVGGFFGAGTADFGGGMYASAGAQDAFIAMYSFNNEGPRITSIKDIGNDQGRLVKLRFNRATRDGDLPVATITNYEVYRKDAAPPSVAAAPHRALITGWTFVGATPAHGDASYALDVPTIGDSTIALGGYNSTFLVRAATAASLTYYESDSDSGYSVDNLAPGIPGSFVFAVGNLTWNESEAKDFDYFTVYGSNTSSFSGATLVNYTTGLAMNVSASPYVYYFVTATDFSGNEGKPASVNSLSGVGGTPASYVLSVSNYPNPFNPRTTVKYTVPLRGMVDINVYDASGAHVATLFHGERNAGAYSVDWDGHANGDVSAASGIYFARISLNGETRTKKMVLLK